LKDDAIHGDTCVRDISRLPKAHLHLHFEASARPATIVELAARAGVAVYQVPTTFATFDLFNSAYDTIVGFITEPDDVVRICREIVEDEAIQGVHYTEPMIRPATYCERFGMSESEVFDLMRDAFLAAGAEFGVEVGLMIAGIWTFPIELIEEAAGFAADQSDRGVVAFGLAGVEPQGGYERYLRACDIARDAGLAVIPHAGEFGGPTNVRQAMDVLRGDRIAHGVRAIEDAELVLQLADRQMVCDTAPSSNVVLGVFPEMMQVPIAHFLEAGVPFTLNSDDQLFFTNRIVDEYVVVRDTFGLSDGEVSEIARTSVSASRASEVTKARMRTGIDDWLAASV
jgi:adenosine deaminase